MQTSIPGDEKEENNGLSQEDFKEFILECLKDMDEEKPPKPTTKKKQSE